jgi:hypothetical protein
MWDGLGGEEYEKGLEGAIEEAESQCHFRCLLIDMYDGKTWKRTS